MSRPADRSIALLLMLATAAIAGAQSPAPVDAAAAVTPNASNRPPTVSVWCASTVGTRTECRANTEAGSRYPIDRPWRVLGSADIFDKY